MPRTFFPVYHYKPRPRRAVQTGGLESSHSQVTTVFFIYDTDHSADASIFVRHLLGKGLYIFFSDVIGVGSRDSEHSLDSGVNQFLGIYFIDVKGVNFFKDGGKDFQALA